MRYKSKVLLICFCLLAVCAGCGLASGGGSDDGRAASGYPLTVVDSLGREVKIEDEPRQVASMAPSVTETVYAVGAGKKVAGVTTVDDYPPRVTKVAKIGNFARVNAEKVASLGIDVLFLSYDTTTKEMAEDLEAKTGAEVAVINPGSVEEAIGSVGKVGTIVGEKERARSLQKRMRAEIEEVRSAVEGEAEPAVFYELGYDPLYTVGPGSFVQDAIEIAGGRNVAADAGQAYPQYPVEKLVQRDPQYYLVSSSSGNTAEDVKGREEYSSLDAVREDRVFVLNDALISRPGPRIVKGVRLIAETIHPDAFE